MKKIILMMAIMICLVGVFSSCEKDEITPETETETETETEITPIFYPENLTFKYDFNYSMPYGDGCVTLYSITFVDTININMLIPSYQRFDDYEHDTGGSNDPTFIWYPKSYSLNSTYNFNDIVQGDDGYYTLKIVSLSENNQIYYLDNELMYDSLVMNVKWHNSISGQNYGYGHLNSFEILSAWTYLDGSYRRNLLGDSQNYEGMCPDKISLSIHSCFY